MNKIISAVLLISIIFISGCVQTKGIPTGFGPSTTGSLSECKNMNCEAMPEGNNKVSCFVTRNLCYYKIANETGNITICESATPAGMQSYDYDQEMCYKELAINKEDISLCNKITEINLKDSCYEAIAKELKDASICGQINDITDKNECYKNMAWLLKDRSLCDAIVDPAYMNNYRKNLCIDGFK